MLKLEEAPVQTLFVFQSILSLPPKRGKPRIPWLKNVQHSGFTENR